MIIIIVIIKIIIISINLFSFWAAFSGLFLLVRPSIPLDGFMRSGLLFFFGFCILFFFGFFISGLSLLLHLHYLIFSQF